MRVSAHPDEAPGTRRKEQEWTIVNLSRYGEATDGIVSLCAPVPQGPLPGQGRLPGFYPRNTGLGPPQARSARWLMQATRKPEDPVAPPVFPCWTPETPGSIVSFRNYTKCKVTAQDKRLDLVAGVCRPYGRASLSRFLGESCVIGGWRRCWCSTGGPAGGVVGTRES